MIGLLDQGGRAAREAADVASSELRLAAVTTAGEHIVPPLIEAFSSLHPEIKLNLDVGNRERVFERVRMHRSDVAIGGRPPGEGVMGERFLDNPIVVITKPGDPLARKRSVAIEQLAERPWLMREEGSGTRTMTEEILAANGLDPPVLTLGSNGAIKQGVRAGLGVSLQSRLAMRLELELGSADDDRRAAAAAPSALVSTAARARSDARAGAAVPRASHAAPKLGGDRQRSGVMKAGALGSRAVPAQRDSGARHHQVVEDQKLDQRERLRAVQVDADRELAQPLAAQVSREMQPIPDRLLDLLRPAPGRCRPGCTGAAPARAPSC